VRRGDSLDALRSVHLGNLANCITVTIPVEGLPPEESISFIEGRLKACGTRAALFTKNALTLGVHSRLGARCRRPAPLDAHHSMLKAMLDTPLLAVDDSSAFMTERRERFWGCVARHDTESGVDHEQGVPYA
jgi:hypothetical protein